MMLNKIFFKKPVGKGYIQHGSIYMTFPRWQNDRDVEDICDCQKLVLGNSVTIAGWHDKFPLWWLNSSVTWLWGWLLNYTCVKISYSYTHIPPPSQRNSACKNWCNLNKGRAWVVSVVSIHTNFLVLTRYTVYIKYVQWWKLGEKYREPYYLMWFYTYCSLKKSIVLVSLKNYKIITTSQESDKNISTGDSDYEPVFVPHTKLGPKKSYNGSVTLRSVRPSIPQTYLAEEPLFHDI